MLGHMRKWLAFHVQAIIQSLQSFCFKPFNTLMTVMVIAITLALPALFWVFTDNAQQLVGNWQRSGHISLYLKSTLTKAQETLFLSKVRTMPGVEEAIFISPAEALDALKHQEGMQDIMSYLPENPLPAVIDILPSSQLTTPEEIDALYQQLKNQSEVDQAKLDTQWVHRLHAIFAFVVSLSEGLMLLLALAVMFIIGNTLRLMVQYRQEQIQVLKLVGAKDAFILRPFLYTGIFYGLFGAVVAIFFLNLFMLGINLAVETLAAAYQMHYAVVGLSLGQMSFLILVAIVLGWLAAFLAVRRQLAVIEP